MAIPFPDVDPVLIHIWGKLAIRWYSLAYIAGLVLGWWWIVRMIRDKPLWRNPPFERKAPATEDDIGDLLVWATLGVIIGGRVGWVLFYGTILCSVTPDGGFCGGPINHLPGDFIDHPLRLVSAWDGGMSFHGGLIGMLVALWLFARRRKLDFVKVGDLVASVAPIGLFFGRLANFINGELWGKPTDVPWSMVFCTPHIMETNGGACPAGLITRHPSQLYEAGLEGLLLFVILQIGIHRLRWHERPGLVSAVFFLGYGLSRVFVELFREPDAAFLGPISMGQALSFPMWLIAGYFFWYALWRSKQPQTAT
ncbi:MAG TPA: prolipoprotein diacylglyceryl transferase [Rhizomicrobium sp.]|jgi:phosphatidylglycerol:prolipoprotein diacylglycerol transferase|nr:prolipoprotein diacylglyceryl transferase [Rhizomicrobium sp.]